MTQPATPELPYVHRHTGDWARRHFSQRLNNLAETSGERGRLVSLIDSAIHKIIRAWESRAAVPIDYSSVSHRESLLVHLSQSPLILKLGGVLPFAERIASGVRGLSDQTRRAFLVEAGNLDGAPEYVAELLRKASPMPAPARR